MQHKIAVQGAPAPADVVAPKAFSAPIMISFAFVVVTVTVVDAEVPVLVGAVERFGSNGDPVLTPETAMNIILIFMVAELNFAVKLSELRAEVVMA